MTKAVKGNYEDAASGGKKFNERPPMKRKVHVDYDLSDGLKADELHPDIGQIIKSHR